MQRCFEARRAVLEEALTAAARRTYWSAAPETPSGKLDGEPGAIAAGAYSISTEVLDQAAGKLAAAGVNLSCKLTGLTFVNRGAAFSDYHVTGSNPSGNACLRDTAFVAGRFRDGRFAGRLLSEKGWDA